MTYPNKSGGKIQICCQKHNAYTSGMLYLCPWAIQIYTCATKSPTGRMDDPIALRSIHMDSIGDNSGFCKNFLHLIYTHCLVVTH